MEVRITKKTKRTVDLLVRNARRGATKIRFVEDLPTTELSTVLGDALAEIPPRGDYVKAFNEV